MPESFRVATEQGNQFKLVSPFVHTYAHSQCNIITNTHPHRNTCRNAAQCMWSAYANETLVTNDAGTIRRTTSKNNRRTLSDQGESTILDADSFSEPGCPPCESKSTLRCSKVNKGRSPRRPADASTLPALARWEDAGHAMQQGQPCENAPVSERRLCGTRLLTRRLWRTTMGQYFKHTQDTLDKTCDRMLLISANAARVQVDPAMQQSQHWKEGKT